MEIPIYSFEGTMELNEWFQWLEEYFDYANIQNERDKTLTMALHLTGQAYAWVRRNYEYWTPSFPWDTFKNFREELEFEEKWNYKERKALELEYKEEAWGVEDDDSEFEIINVEFKVGKYMEEKTGKEKLEEEQLEYILDEKEENNKEDKSTRYDPLDDEEKPMEINNNTIPVDTTELDLKIDDKREVVLGCVEFPI
eukprot:Gb_16390 [translate_table: standard]